MKVYRVPIRRARVDFPFLFIFSDTTRIRSKLRRCRCIAAQLDWVSWAERTATCTYKFRLKKQSIVYNPNMYLTESRIPTGNSARNPESGLESLRSSYLQNSIGFKIYSPIDLFQRDKKPGHRFSSMSITITIQYSRNWKERGPPGAHA